MSGVAMTCTILMREGQSRSVAGGLCGHGEGPPKRSFGPGSCSCAAGVIPRANWRNADSTHPRGSSSRCSPMCRPPENTSLMDNDRERLFAFAAPVKLSGPALPHGSCTNLAAELGIVLHIGSIAVSRWSRKNSPIASLLFSTRRARLTSALRQNPSLRRRSARAARAIAKSYRILRAAARPSWWTCRSPGLVFRSVTT